MVRLEDAFRFEQVCKFQDAADNFCAAYRALTGRDGMTHYFHLLQAGHYSFYLLKYHNLYRYSQQGWERFNSRLKRTYHHKTAKGGGKEGGSKLEPVVYSVAREMTWRLGHLAGLF